MRGAAALHVPHQRLPRRDLPLLQRELRQQRLRLRWTGTWLKRSYLSAGSRKILRNYIRSVYIDVQVDFH